MCATYIAAYGDCLRPAANLLTLHLSETLYHLTHALCDGDADVGASAITKSFKVAFGLLKKLARSFNGSRKALGAITTSYLALKRTVMSSSTLRHLVDFIYKEHQAVVNPPSRAEPDATQQPTRSSYVPPQSTGMSQIPASATTNDDAGIGFDLDQLLAHDKSGLQWPVMNDVDLGTMEVSGWPELQLTLGREVNKSWAPDNQDWLILSNGGPANGTQATGEFPMVA